MPARETTAIEAVAGGPNQRVYIPQKFRVQHDYPFRPGEPIALQLVEADCGRPVVVLTKEMVEIDADASTLSLTRSDSNEQLDLNDIAEATNE